METEELIRRTIRIFERVSKELYGVIKDTIESAQIVSEISVNGGFNDMKTMINYSYKHDLRLGELWVRKDRLDDVKKIFENSIYPVSFTEGAVFEDYYSLVYFENDRQKVNMYLSSNKIPFVEPDHMEYRDLTTGPFDFIDSRTEISNESFMYMDLEMERHSSEKYIEEILLTPGYNAIYKMGIISAKADAPLVELLMDSDAIYDFGKMCKEKDIKFSIGKATDKEKTSVIVFKGDIEKMIPFFNEKGITISRPKSFKTDEKSVKEYNKFRDKCGLFHNEFRSVPDRPEIIKNRKTLGSFQIVKPESLIAKIEKAKKAVRSLNSRSVKERDERVRTKEMI